MKIPLKWLADYVPLSLPVAELVRGSRWPASRSARFVVRPAGPRRAARQAPRTPAPSGTATRSSSPRSLDVEKHPNADKLKLPTVDYGDGRAEERRHRRARTSTSATAARRSSSAWPARATSTATPRRRSSSELKPTQDPRRAQRRHGHVRRSSWASPTSTRASSSSTTTPRSARRSPTSWATSSSKSTCCRTWPAACR